ncbi:MAG: hypothetical protein HY699_06270 [Deltaproteobacteria bacterium]|nr:hypothetical protein [Deltaproteobacteria bacterium]
MHCQWRKLAAVLVLAVAGLARAQDVSPEETVTRYLTALKAGKFTEAYPYVSKAMAQDKGRDEWAKEQQWMMQAAEAKIFEFTVYPGKIAGDKALVPNLLSSQDKFLNQLGVEEQELYTLIREDGRWKINQQQIVEKADIPKWFPQQSKPGTP